MKRIYFVRHGETIGNLEKFFQLPDTELSDAGHCGGRAVGERFRDVTIDQIVSSPYTRARQTAQYISDIKNIPVDTFEALHEKVHKESIRGKAHASEEGAPYMIEQREYFWNADWGPEGAENFYTVIDRVATSVTFLEESACQNIVIVSHGEFLKSMTAYLLAGKDPALEINKPIFSSLKQMSNVGITEFIHDQTSWKLVTWNDTAHFAE